MRIALTGASGFIGAAIARRLKADGHLVHGMVRETSRRDHVDDLLDRVVVGLQEQEDAQAQLLADADALVHNSVDWEVLKNESIDRHIEVNLTPSLKLFQAAADASIPVVFLSSVAVHHHMRDRWSGNVDEDHPSRPGSLYGALKSSLESHLWALHTMKSLSFTSLRPAAVYGIDPRTTRSIGYPIIRAIAEDGAYERSGGGKFVHVDDVAACTAAALERPHPSAGVYHLADCYARWGDWASITADLLGVQAQINLESPTAARNTFVKSAVQDDLGVAMDRGHDGIRTHLGELIDVMRTQGELSPAAS
ncbi:MAG: NAD(P)-dependent oxidoreductase [Planctomycetota bacterium]|nr:NAD(P)-dependent oxidoreductase [Planctomycetota bacterium]